MRLTKFVKRVTALALTGIMCISSVALADQFSNPRYVVDSAGIEMSRTYIDRDNYSYSMETIVAKDYAGRNKYNSSIAARLYVRVVETGQVSTRDHSSSVYAGYTSNPKVGYKYTDFTIMSISATVTTGGRYIIINY